MREWQPIETFDNRKEPVDIWVQDGSMKAGGQRFADMSYIQGGLGQRNDWDCVDGMMTLTDCGYSLEAVTHWMAQPEPPETEA